MKIWQLNLTLEATPLGPEIFFVDLIKNLANWLEDGSHKLYKQELQVKKPMEIGFLCWSTMKMDKNALLDDIHNDCHISCGLQWKVIYAGKKERFQTKIRCEIFILLLTQ